MTICHQQRKLRTYGYRSLVGVLVLVWASTLVLGSGVLAGGVLTDPVELAGFIDQRMVEKMEEHRIPGAVVAVVKDGEVVLAAGYGYADIDRSLPVNPEQTLFRPGSVSKLFTWTAVLQLVDQGRLDLDADVNTYLDFTIPGELKSGAAAEPITLRHLMTHTPGFEDVLEGLFFLSAEMSPPLGETLQQFLPARIWPPGELLAYSNYGTALAGYIVERVSGQSFADYVEEHIFAPLNMQASTFRQPLPQAMANELARGYKYSDERYHEGSFEFIPMSPAGAMSTSAVDMAQFMLMQLQQGRYGETEILSEETMAAMHQRQFASHPSLDGVTLGMFESTVNGRQVVAHNGATMLYYTHLFLVPEEEFGFFISASGGNDVGDVLQMQERLFQALMDEEYPTAPRSVPRQAAGASQRLTPYLGEYHPTRMNFSGPEKFLGLLGAIRVQRSEDDYLLVNLGGESHEFVELEAGVYQNLRINEQPSVERIAFVDGPGGEPVLSVGAATFTPAPWYGTLSLLGALGAAALGLLLLSTLGWLIAAIRRRRRRRYTRSRPGPVGQGTARWAAVLFFIVALAFLAGIILVFSDIDPAYGVPNMVFGIVPAFMGVINALPWVLLGLGGIMVLFTLFAWRNHFWNWLARMHYTLLTVSVLGLLWVLWFTNQISL